MSIALSCVQKYVHRHGVLAATAGLGLLLLSGCSSKTEEAGSGSTASPDGSQSASPKGPAAPQGGAKTYKTGSYTAPPCNVPEPPPSKVGPADPSYAAKFAQVAKCEEVGPCDAEDKLIDDAKATISNDNVASPAVISACVAGLDHESARARKTAAKCVQELGYSTKDKAPVVLRVIEKIEADREGKDRFYLAFALGPLNPGGVGYTCRILKLVRTLPPADGTTSEVLGSLSGLVSSPSNEAFDFAYEFVLGNNPGVVTARAMGILTNRAPEARKGEVCGRLEAVMKAGVDGWGEASTAIWRDETCQKRDVVIASIVARLKEMESMKTYKETERPLLNMNFIDDVTTWKGITDAQKKSVCDAAKSLAANAKDEDAKKQASKLAGTCK